jgi:hypothetical protein
LMLHYAQLLLFSLCGRFTATFEFSDNSGSLEP